MKNLKYMSLMMALTLVFTLGFVSCDSDDDDLQPAPEITIEEANIEGDILCTESDVVAKGRTAAILHHQRPAGQRQGVVPRDRQQIYRCAQH